MLAFFITLLSSGGLPNELNKKRKAREDHKNTAYIVADWQGKNYVVATAMPGWYCNEWAFLREMRVTLCAFWDL